VCFLALLTDRARTFGWTDAPGGILIIPEDPMNPAAGTPTNLLTHFGLRTLEQVRAFETTFYNTQTRRAQDSDMLYNCIMDSLSDVGRNKVNLHRTEFIINNVPCGVCLLKVVIRESAIDSNATANSIRNQLSDDVSRHEGSPFQTTRLWGCRVEL